MTPHQQAMENASWFFVIGGLAWCFFAPLLRRLFDLLPRPGDREAQRLAADERAGGRQRAIDKRL